MSGNNTFSGSKSGNPIALGLAAITVGGLVYKLWNRTNTTITLESNQETVENTASAEAPKEEEMLSEEPRTEQNPSAALGATTTAQEATSAVEPTVVTTTRLAKIRQALENTRANISAGLKSAIEAIQNFFAKLGANIKSAAIKVRNAFVPAQSTSSASSESRVQAARNFVAAQGNAFVSFITSPFRAIAARVSAYRNASTIETTSVASAPTSPAAPATEAVNDGRYNTYVAPVVRMFDKCRTQKQTDTADATATAPRAGAEAAESIPSTPTPGLSL